MTNCFNSSVTLGFIFQVLPRVADIWIWKR